MSSDWSTEVNPVTAINMYQDGFCSEGKAIWLPAIPTDAVGEAFP